MLCCKCGNALFQGKIYFFFYFGGRFFGLTSFFYIVWTEANDYLCECEAFICFQWKKLRKAWKIKRKKPENEQGLPSG